MSCSLLNSLIGELLLLVLVVFSRFRWTFFGLSRWPKNLPANAGEVRVQSLGQENPLKQEMATHSSILAWRIPWTEESDGLQSVGSQRVGHGWSNFTHTLADFLQEGLCHVHLCLENIC